MKLKPQNGLAASSALRLVAGLLTAGFVQNPAASQSVPLPPAPVRSASGQFLIFATPASAPKPKVPKFANNENYLKLDPAVAAVSCERIKSALMNVLGDRSPWQGKIRLVPHPALSADEEPTLVAERFKNTWNYRLELPDPLERPRFVRAIIQALLLEQANRNADVRAAEIPVWLAEGLTRHLLALNPGELLLTPPRATVNGLMATPTTVNRFPRDPLEGVRRSLSEQTPLTLAELTSPTDEHFVGPAGALYRSSAELFVTELLRLKDGRACLRAMIGQLATCYNWQTVFFRAFHSHFERQLDLEKWWAVTTVHYSGRSPDLTWSMEESWRKLDEVLRTPVELRRSPGELPEAAELPLDTIIREWDFVRQTDALRVKLRELDLVRVRFSRDLAELADSYRHLLATYLERRSRAGHVLPGSKTTSPGFRSVMRDTLKELAALENRRAMLRPQPPAAPSGENEKLE